MNEIEINTDNFLNELTEFIQSIFDESTLPKNEQWKNNLKVKVQSLVGKYWSKPSFVVGDAQDEISISSSSHIEGESKSQEDDKSLKYGEYDLLSQQVRKDGKSREISSVVKDLVTGTTKHRNLEKTYPTLASIELRRLYIQEKCSLKPAIFANLPYKFYNYDEVKDACCENLIGYVPMPTGFAGSIKIDDEEIPIPLSTTEGALVASVSRGIKAINESVKPDEKLSVFVTKDGMTRAPLIEFETISEALQCQEWIMDMRNYSEIKNRFERTSRFLRLIKIEPTIISTHLFLRFVATTGDAMGMNMVTNATSECLKYIKSNFNTKMIVISGNMCVDKKPSAMNWIEGRGKSVLAEVTIPSKVVETIFKTTVDKMVSLSHAKLNLGTSAAITIGGWNAHAANVVAAIFLATGQDAAQVVSSGMCLTELKKRETSGALHITCTMPCLEVGTVGGGTILSPQRSCLEILGCAGNSSKNNKPGDNAKRLARIICAAVLAGELSLLAAQCNEGELEQSHMRLNRSQRNLEHLDPSSQSKSRLPALSTVDATTEPSESNEHEHIKQSPSTPQRKIKHHLKATIKNKHCALG